MRAESLRGRLIRMFVEADNAHHHAFRETDGEDSQWPQWYASHLINLLGPTLGVWFSHAALAEELRELEARRLALSPPPSWPEFYADHFIKTHTSEQRRKP